jgi:AcrR family transcriptional regulator
MADPLPPYSDDCSDPASFPSELLLFDPRPSRADAVKNRQLLLETARSLFAQQGIEAVSMTAISEAADVGKGTLYRHFKNKAELCHALLDHEQSLLQAQTLQRLRAGGLPLEHLRWFLAEVAYFVSHNADLLSVSDPDSGGVVNLEHPAHVWWRQTIHGLLIQLNLTGDMDYLTDVLYILLDARTIRFQQQILGYSLQRIQDGLIATLLKLVNA